MSYDKKTRQFPLPTVLFLDGVMERMFNIVESPSYINPSIHPSNPNPIQIQFNSIHTTSIMQIAPCSAVWTRLLLHGKLWTRIDHVLHFLLVLCGQHSARSIHRGDRPASATNGLRLEVCKPQRLVWSHWREWMKN